MLRLRFWGVSVTGNKQSFGPNQKVETLVSPESSED